MGKAILVLDEIPERCEDCPLKADDGYPNCMEHVDEYPITETPTKGRQAWCPLKKLPDEMKGIGAYACGWNDYRDAIGGGND